MIHYNPECNNQHAHKYTNICKLCALYDHHNFVRSLKMGTQIQNPIHEPVIDAILGGKKWRIQKKPNTECGHPGVRNTGGKCVFCLPQVVKQPHNSVQKLLENTQKEMARLTEYEATLKTYLEFGVTEAPPMPTRPSPRAQAVSEGAKWYMPYNPCKHCGIIAERYVANGRCRNCGK